MEEGVRVLFAPPQPNTRSAKKAKIGNMSDLRCKGVFFYSFVVTNLRTEGSIGFSGTDV